MSEARKRLGRLARLYGIERSYTDLWQRRHVVSAATERALLAAMAVPAASADEVESSLALAEESVWCALLPPVIVTRKHGPAAMVTLPETTCGRIAWSVVTEPGERVRGEIELSTLEVVASGVCSGTTFRRYRLPLPDLPIGYHRLELAAGESACTSLIVAPQRAYGIGDGGEDARLWGVTAPLYGVRSAANWGIGDFADLGRLAATCGRLGASFLGINPIHAQLPAAPEHHSPYSPSSRRFLNVLLIAIEQVPELGHCEAARTLLASPACQSQLQQMRDATLIDYPAVAALKLEVLALLFASLAGSRVAAFEAFRRQSGPSLERQALFDALFEHFRAHEPACTTWRAWPLPYQDPASSEVARFAVEHRERVAFFAYLQWLAQEQLEQAQRQATAVMKLGLYLDLAVGVTPDGAEAWAHRDSIVEGASLGAPPDAFNQAGQNWGLAPLSPHGLRNHAYAPLIAILRSAMAHAGVLRIDHILGLQRSFWWPATQGLAGAYVRQPVEDLLGVVALESHRQRCMVVGEDLGTVPAGLRKMLEDRGVLGCSVLYFERREGGFLPAARYRSGSIASIGTHDLPTLAGFWAGRDIDWREKLGLYKDPQQALRARSEREIERHALLRLLEDEGLLPQGIQPDAPPGDLKWSLVLALHRLLARSPAKLMALQIEDVLGTLEQANLPGTTSEHPNWRRRLGLTTEDLDRSRPLKELGGVVASERPPGVQPIPEPARSTA